jgi:hypothetical protein
MSDHPFCTFCGRKHCNGIGDPILGIPDHTPDMDSVDDREFEFDEPEIQLVNGIPPIVYDFVQFCVDFAYQNYRAKIDSETLAQAVFKHFKTTLEKYANAFRELENEANPQLYDEYHSLIEKLRAFQSNFDVAREPYHYYNNAASFDVLKWLQEQFDEIFHDEVR